MAMLALVVGSEEERRRKEEERIKRERMAMLALVVGSEEERRRKEEERIKRERELLTFIIVSIINKKPNIFDHLHVWFIDQNNIVTNMITKIDKILRLHLCYKRLDKYFTSVFNVNDSNIIKYITGLSKLIQELESIKAIQLPKTGEIHKKSQLFYHNILNSTTNKLYYPSDAIEATIENVSSDSIQSKKVLPLEKSVELYFKSLLKEEKEILKHISKYKRVKDLIDTFNTDNIPPREIQNMDDLNSKISSYNLSYNKILSKINTEIAKEIGDVPQKAEIKIKEYYEIKKMAEQPLSEFEKKKESLKLFTRTIFNKTDNLQTKIKYINSGIVYDLKGFADNYGQNRIKKNESLYDYTHLLLKEYGDNISNILELEYKPKDNESKADIEKRKKAKIDENKDELAKIDVIKQKNKAADYYNNDWYYDSNKYTELIFNPKLDSIITEMKNIINRSINLKNVRTLKYKNDNSVMTHDTKTKIEELNNIINTRNEKNQHPDWGEYLNKKTEVMTFIKGEIQVETSIFFYCF